MQSHKKVTSSIKVIPEKIKLIYKLDITFNFCKIDIVICMHHTLRKTSDSNTICFILFFNIFYIIFFIASWTQRYLIYSSLLYLRSYARKIISGNKGPVKKNVYMARYRPLSKGKCDFYIDGACIIFHALVDSHFSSDCLFKGTLS